MKKTLTVPVNSDLRPPASGLRPKKKATYKEQKEYEALTAEIETLTQEKAALETLLGNGGSPPRPAPASAS